MNGLETCMLCPRLCRPACPVANGTSREAAVPTLIASAVFAWRRGDQGAAFASEALSLCVDCGACEAFCHISHPLPKYLQQAREELDLVPDPEPLQPVEGDGDWIAVEFDDRRWAEALSARMGQSVARLRTDDALGAGAVGTSMWDSHVRALKNALGERKVVVADGGAAKALRHADIAFSWLHDVVPDVGVNVGSCESSGGVLKNGCCGGAGPLVERHSSEAKRMGLRVLSSLDDAQVNDARCAKHLKTCGTRVKDAVARLLEAVNP